MNVIDPIRAVGELHRFVGNRQTLPPNPARAGGAPHGLPTGRQIGNLKDAWIKLDNFLQGDHPSIGD